jgi:hypothetical protein
VSREAAVERALARLALAHPREAQALLDEEFARAGVEVTRRTGLLKDLHDVVTILDRYQP